MAFENWGSVAGDINASAIIDDRRPMKTAYTTAGVASGVTLIGCAIWFGLTGSHAALAGTIVSAVWTINAATAVELFTTHTFSLITERRAQLLEQRLRDLREAVSELRH